jgi:hypothetical protein
MREALFYSFSLERHLPGDHMLRKTDPFVNLSGVRAHLEIMADSESFSSVLE